MNNIIPAFLCKHCKLCKYNTVAVCEHIIKMLVYSDYNVNIWSKIYGPTEVI